MKDAPDRSPPASRRRRKEETRGRIVAAAAASVRAHGYGATGVADVMGRAGLTHGGFYAHFESRDELLAAAADAAGADGIARLARLAEAAPPGMAFAALADAYLSDAHASRADRVCPVAAAGSELPRQAASVRRAATQRIRELIGLLEQHGDAGGQPRGARQAQALARLSCLVGALVVARAVDDPALSRAVRRAARDAALQAKAP